MNRLRIVAAFVVALSSVLHLIAIGDAWETAWRDNNTRDFASYYLAVQVAVKGGDPYDKRALLQEARDRGQRRRGVHPFFYPPPFLLGMSWVAPLPAKTAFLTWFWLDELFLLAAAAALWRWWGHLDPTVVPVALASSVALLYAVPNNHLMGQANAPVLALVMAGLWAADRGRSGHSLPLEVLGGALVGLGCMAKMSPAFFVMWWMLRRQWVAVASACVTAVLISLASLWIVPFDVQWRFYTEVLPGFRSGNYNGLTIPIDLFGNHSIPNLYFQAFDGRGRQLGDLSQILSTGTMLAILAGMAFTFFREPADDLTRAGQVGAVSTSILLVTVYTYEHHVIWAIPAAVVCAVGLMQGRLPRWTALPVGLAWAAWIGDLSALKSIWLWTIRQDIPVVPLLIQEAKFAALVTFFASSMWIGRSHE